MIAYDDLTPPATPELQPSPPQRQSSSFQLTSPPSQEAQHSVDFKFLSKIERRPLPPRPTASSIVDMFKTLFHEEIERQQPVGASNAHRRKLKILFFFGSATHGVKYYSGKKSVVIPQGQSWATLSSVLGELSRTNFTRREQSEQEGDSVNQEDSAQIESSNRTLDSIYTFLKMNCPSAASLDPLVVTLWAGVILFNEVPMPQANEQAEIPPLVRQFITLLSGASQPANHKRYHAMTVPEDMMEDVLSLMAHKYTRQNQGAGVYAQQHPEQHQ